MPHYSVLDAIVQLVEAGLFVGDYVVTTENLITKGVGKVR